MTFEPPASIQNVYFEPHRQEKLDKKESTDLTTVKRGCDIHYSILPFSKRFRSKQTTEGTQKSLKVKNNQKPSKMGSEALGIFDLQTNYRPYSIFNRFVKDKMTGECVEIRNTEKTKELLNYLLDLGNSNSFKVKTDQEAAIEFLVKDVVSERPSGKTFIEEAPC